VLSVAASAQTPGVAFTATLVDGQGNNIKTAYLHWQLWNCGNNVPQVIGAPLVVSEQFDMHANPTAGIITGAVYRNNQLLYGGVQSAQWIVTGYKYSTSWAAPCSHYCLVSPGTFRLAAQTRSHQMVAGRMR